MLLLQIDAGLGASPACESSGDINGDGATNAVDALLIIQFEAGLLEQLGG